ncbi:Glycerophosphodiester phosphodiesterase domain-containing protein 4, partial [Clarias magur]
RAATWKHGRVLAGTALLSEGKGKLYFKSSNTILSLQILLTLAINCFHWSRFSKQEKAGRLLRLTL